ncbi:uncharacterized protein LOC144001083 isoform X1 [Festucalex cinctus]
MINPFTSTIGLIVLLIGCAAADPNKKILSLLPSVTVRCGGRSLHSDEQDQQIPQHEEVDSERSPRAVLSSACQEHTSLHNRADVVEKKVEDTVGKLEVELAALMEAIEDPKWRPHLDNTGTPVDILEDPVNIQS